MAVYSVLNFQNNNILCVKVPWPFKTCWFLWVFLFIWSLHVDYWILLPQQRDYIPACTLLITVAYWIWKKNLWTYSS